MNYKKLNPSFYLNNDVIKVSKELLGKVLVTNLNKTITSPTFTLINEYQLDQIKIFHYDLYKIKSTQELIDIGINDYLNQNALHFFEWPKNCASLLPRPNVIIDLINVHSGRLIKVTIKPYE